MFLANNPLDEMNQQQQMQQSPQMGAPPPSQPGMFDMLKDKAVSGFTTKAAAGLAGGPMGFAAEPLVSGLFGMFLNDGTPHVGGMQEPDFGPDPMMKYNNGTSFARQPQMLNMGGYANAMRYAQGTDSVPAMLTPGEAVIPAGAAQDPMNQGAIQGMINQGQQMNQGMPAPSPMGGPMGQPMGQPMEPQMHQMPDGNMMPGEEHQEDDMMGPLSGKAKRENMKLVQDMSLKKKSWMAEEQRKQEMHMQKIAEAKRKAMESSRMARE